MRLITTVAAAALLAGCDGSSTLMDAGGDLELEQVDQVDQVDQVLDAGDVEVMNIRHGDAGVDLVDDVAQLDQVDQVLERPGDVAQLDLVHAEWIAPPDFHCNAAAPECSISERCLPTCGGSSCVPGGGFAGVGASCSRTDDCLPALGCDSGTCRHWCRVASDCAAGLACVDQVGCPADPVLGFCR